jgi:hypothetical protein
MATTLNFKDVVDLPQWRPEAPTLAASAAGMTIASDMRNNATRHPYMYLLRSTTALDFFDPTTGDWMPLASPTLGGSIVGGATAVFNPSQGPRGTLAAGSTTTNLVLSTALPASVGANQLANRGDGVGFRIRVIGNTAGGSGIIEERTIIANSSGTTPQITLDSALSFTPATGAGYEILSGRVFMLSAGTTAAGFWKHYDIATNSYSGNLATTNLIATISTDSFIVPLSEQYVPNDRVPGSGFVNGGASYNAAAPINCIQATAASGTTITGSGMTAINTNEYRNFQVRIVEDTVTPTAVGQRRRITSHTSGATGVFTVPTFTVTPSSSAKFVVENDDDKMILRTSAVTTTYTYNIAGNAWDTTTFSASGSACGFGTCGAQAFGITRDATGNTTHSEIVLIRGGASNAIDILDIAGGANGLWTNGITYGNQSQTFTTGTCAQYAPATLGGRFIYLNVNGTQRMARFDIRNNVMDTNSYLRFPQGTAIVGGKMGLYTFIDGATKLGFIYHLTNSSTNLFSLATWR